MWKRSFDELFDKHCGSAQSPLYSAQARELPDGEWMPVSLGNQVFAASKGLVEAMIELMKAKYPQMEYRLVGGGEKENES